MTEHFSHKEIACKCGCNAHAGSLIRSRVRILVNMLEVIRLAVGKPINVNSMVRCERHNFNVGGASKSYHMRGMAADIWVKGMTPEELRGEIARLCVEGKLPRVNMIVYKTFLHVDTRNIYIE